MHNGVAVKPPPKAANLVDNEFLLFAAVRKLRDTDGVFAYIFNLIRTKC